MEDEPEGGEQSGGHMEEGEYEGENAEDGWFYIDLSGEVREGEG